MCKLDDSVVAALQSGSPLPGALSTCARLLVFLDGLDELQGEAPACDGPPPPPPLADLYTTLCGGADRVWPSSSLRVVVTSRESHLRCPGEESRVLGAHRRRVLLPFSNSQVRRLVGEGPS